MTIILGLQYGLLVALPAIEHHTHPERQILAICAVGVAVALGVEVILLPIRPTTRMVRSIVTPRSANVVFAVGAVSELASGLLGAGSYAVQIGTASESHLASLFTPFTYWMLFGLLMMLWLYHGRHIGRRRVFAAITIAFVLEAGVSYQQAFFDPLLALALPLFVGMVLARLIRARWLIIVVVLAVIVAPTLLNLRNERRVSLGAPIGQAGASSLSQRLRYDELMSQIDLLPSRPYDFDQPSVALLVRFGLIPRLIDPGRPTLNTAERISDALGGTSTNSAGLTPLGEAYAFNGWVGVFLLVGPLTVVAAFAVRRRSVWGFVLFGILLQSGMSIFGTYPDQLAQVLQSVESASIAMLLCTLLREHGSTLIPRD